MSINIYFFNLRSKNQTADNDILGRWLIEEVGRKNEQSVEPTTSLINTFRNEIGRESVLEFVLVLERIVLLSIRHRTRLEPAIKDFFNTAKDTTSSLGRNGDVINAKNTSIV